MSQSDPQGMELATKAVPVKAGARKVGAAFVKTFEGPVNDNIAPIGHSLADTQIGSQSGITVGAHLEDLIIRGPARRPASRRRPAATRFSAAIRRPPRTNGHAPSESSLALPAKPTGVRCPKTKSRRSRRSTIRGERRRFRDRRSHCARSDPRQPAVHLPCRGAARLGQTRRARSDQQHRSRVPAVVFPLGRAARLDAHHARQTRRVERPGRSQGTDPADDRRSARRCARDAVRRPMAPIAGHRQGPPRRD